MTDLTPVTHKHVDLALAAKALSGDRDAQALITERATPIARKAARGVCKPYCGKNRFNYVCSVDARWGRQGTDALRCDWGDFSFVFFLDEMASSKALARYRADNGTSLEGYWIGTLSHIGVYERWKDERFGRRTHVPAVVRKLGPDAVRVFWRLLDGDRFDAIAQRFGWKHEQAQQLIRDVEQALLAEGLLHVLVPTHEILATDTATSTTSTTSISEDESISSHDLVVASHDLPADDVELRERVRSALHRLPWLERFVVTAMVIDELGAKAVLQALREQGVSIKDGVEPADLNTQHVYYFLYRCLEKLKVDCEVPQHVQN